MVLKVRTYRKDGTSFTMTARDEYQAQTMVRQAKKYGLKTEVYEHTQKKRKSASRSPFPMTSSFGQSAWKSLGRF